MRTLLVAVAMVAALPATIAMAEQPRGQKLAKPPVSGKRLPIKGAGYNDSCAAYGEGFVKVDGNETCVKIGGAIGIGAGVSSGGR